MKLQTTNNGKSLEFNEDIEVDKLDLYHNEYFLDLLEMVDKLRFILSDAIDYRDSMNNRICPEDDDSILEEWKQLEKEAIELLTNICKE